jgi:plasmid stabilization system protein ParE
MALTVFWTKFAKEKLAEIFEYYKATAGTKVAQKLINAIINHTEGLELNSTIGQTEELLSDRQNQFRHLIFKHYKIIYWINTAKHRIDISHVFDTRQNPFKIREIK